MKSKMPMGHPDEEIEWVVRSKSLEFSGEVSLFTGESGREV